MKMKSPKSQAKTTDFYNRFSWGYPLIDRLLHHHKNKLYQQLTDLPEGKLLDIGIGTGRMYTGLTHLSITGMDTSVKMLSVCKKTLPNASLHLKPAHEVNQLEENYDYIVMAHVVSVLPNLKEVLPKISNQLKPGGKLFILNHFSSTPWHRIMDFFLIPIGQIFRLQSYFPLTSFLEDLSTTNSQLTLVQQQSIGKLGYYQLLAFTKKA